MLESLDTLIAFAVIMTVVSLLISVIVQMLSAALNLRGKNLANGLVETFLTAGGNKADAALKLTVTEAQKLTGYLLTRTGLSDHTMGGGGSISSSADRQAFAGQTKPLGGPVNWALAGTVRPDEIFAALRELSRLPANDPGDALNTQARKLLAALGVPQAALDDAATKHAEARKFLAQLEVAGRAASAGLEPSRRDQVMAAFKLAETSANDTVEAASRAVAETAEALVNAYEKFRFWFESGQDRAQQWFTTQTRWVTLALAIIFAFIFQLDTIEIYRDLVRNPSTAKVIAAQASAVTDQAERILSESTNFFPAAITKWTAMQDADAKTKLQPIANITFASGDTRGDAVRQVMEKLGGKVPAGIKGTFEDALDEVVTDRLKLKSGQYQDLRTALEKSGFELMKSGSDWRWGKSYFDQFGTHFFGMLFSAALLALGAPFWFNALKGLTNLRSALAKDIEKEREEPARKRAKIPR